jgi:hypothetical protein
MIATGKLWYDSTITLMDGDLAVYDTGEHALSVLDDSGRALIATGLDPKG